MAAYSSAHVVNIRGRSVSSSGLGALESVAGPVGLLSTESLRQFLRLVIFLLRSTSVPVTDAVLLSRTRPLMTSDSDNSATFNLVLVCLLAFDSCLYVVR